MFLLPDSNNRTSESYEEVYYEIARNLNAGISIPFSLKIGSSFTNIIGLADKLRVFGASGLVLFNRFFEPDIDIESMSIVSANRLSYPSEITKSLRWIGVLSDETKEFDIAASTGVHDGEAAIKLLLAGAQAIQICSVIYAEGLEIIDEIKDDIISWMVDKNYKKIEDFRYKLNAKSVGANSLYSRSQFMKYYSDAKEITY